MAGVLGVCLVVGIVVSLVVRGHPAYVPGAALSSPTADPTTATASTPSTARSATASARPSASGGPHSDPLGATAAAYVSTRSGTVLAAVYDVSTGQTWSLGQGKAQDEASVVKLDVLETLLAQRGAGGLSASDQSLAQSMIEDSDNDSATNLWDEVGGAAGIRAFNNSAKLTDTSPSLCVNCPNFPWPGWGLTTTVPTDQLTLLKALIGPGPLTKAERDYALSLMENVTESQRWGVSGGVPAQVTVALKNGWLPLDTADTDWQINSVGWISGQGRNYLMAVLSTGNPSEQYGIDTIDQLAAMVWNRLG
ncbi:MAG TPA: serine hydrolase [Acidimicrobiales bacterium]|nr:serine hydrolase [Acidimicrobiales bacterium]